MNTPVNKYRYRITNRLGVIETNPLRESDFTIEWQRQDEDQYDYEKTMPSKILFRGAAYDTLYKLERSIYRCDINQIEIERQCGSLWELEISGRMSLNDGTWNPGRCEVSIKLLDQNPAQCLLDNKGTELNLLQRVFTRYAVQMISPNITIEKVTYSDLNTGDICGGGFYWNGSGDPTAQGWNVYSHVENYVDEEHGCSITTKWARQKLTVPCGELPPGPEWILITDTCPGGNKVYAKQVQLYNCRYTYPDYASGESGFSMNCDIMGDTGTLTVIDNGMHLTDCLNAFVNEYCTGLTIKSDFFSINPSNSPIGSPIHSGTTLIIISGFTIRVYGIGLFGVQAGQVISVMGINYSINAVTYVPSPGYHLLTVDKSGPSGSYPSTPYAIYNGSTGINYVTGGPSKTANIMVYQKSDVKRPNVTGNASKALISFEKLMKALIEMYNVRWRVTDGVLIIEHISFFSKNTGLDLTLPRYAERIAGWAEYSYNTSKIPQREEYTFKEAGTGDFTGVPIVYTGGCVASGPKSNVIKHDVEDVTTDVQLCLDNPASDSERVDDQGLVLIATQTDGENFWVISEAPILGGSTLNNSMAWAQLQRDYHKHYRPLRTGIMNNIPTTFFSVQPTKQYAPISVPLCCGDNFNPDDLVNTPFGPLVVDKGTYGFKDEMLNLSLLGPSDDGLVVNNAPIANHDTATTYQSVPVIINVLANDTDPDGGGTIQGIEIVSPPVNGTATITADNKIRYSPNPGYNGDEYITYRCFDNWHEYSNNALVSIIVYPPNQPPVANNDAFTMVMGNVLNYPAPGVFSNDSDDVSFTLNGYSPASSQGGTVVVNSNGSFTYTPPSTSFYGTDTFTYTIKDSANVVSAPATVTITVQNLTLPTARPDSYSTIRNQNLTVPAPGVLANDSVGSVGTLAAVPVTKSTTQGGTVVISANGSIQYTVPSGFTGNDTFTYQATNGAGGTATATVTINVLPPVYVRMVQTNRRQRQVILQCPNATKGGYEVIANYVAYFYQDSAGTVPFNVTGLGLNLNIRNSVQTSQTGTPPSVFISVEGPAVGSVWQLYTDILVSENTTDCQGNPSNFYNNTRTLAPGNYTII